ncbi:MAG: patatin-like phospholipase family protein [Rhodanobacteraceae bacterium]|nr:patatin-like phospholipase family protein [Rhodanobacteraceae bacterium]
MQEHGGNGGGGKVKAVDINEVIRAERELLKLPPEDMGQKDTMALCLSGGGIRSATFSLGVLQGLAKRGLLGRFHYLSSVSGGGYISTWLAAWISRRSRAEVEEALRQSVDAGTSHTAGGSEASAIKRLRAYSNFLTPVRGVSGDSAALVAIYARNLLLHWMMLLPLVFAVLLIPRLFNAALLAMAEPPLPPAAYPAAAALFFLAMLFAALDVPLIRHLSAGKTQATQPGSLVWIGFLLPLTVAIFVILLAHCASPESSFRLPQANPWIPIGWGGLVGALAAVCGASFHIYRHLMEYRRQHGLRSKDNRWQATCLIFVANNAATGALTGLLLWLALRGIDYFMPDSQSKVTFGLPLLVCVLSLAAILRAGLSRRWTSEEVREWWGRASGLLGLFAAGWLLLALVVIQLPHWLLSWASTKTTLIAGAASTGSVLLTIITAFAGYWSQNGAQIKEKAHSLSQAIGVRVMELAGMASVLVLALVASLLMGCLLTLEPFVTKTKEAMKVAHCAVVQQQKEAVDPKPKDSPSCPLENVPSGSSTPTAANADAQQAGKLVQQPATAARAAPAGAKAAANGTVGAAANGGNTQPDAAAASATHGKDRKSMAGTPAGAKSDVGEKAQATNTAGSVSAKANTESDGKNNLVPLEQRFAFKWLVQHHQSLNLPGWRPLLLLLLLLCATGFAASWLFGANAFSLNALYGNRLTRAYLGASRSKNERQPHPFIGFDDKDNLSLTSLKPSSSNCDARLFPVINAALNLVEASGDRLEWQQRMAAAFFMTPTYCGSDVLGFVPTGEYGSKEGGLTAGRAMAISGAAAAPSMGYHSSRFVSMLMAFFNIRLGWWMPNPSRTKVLQKNEPEIGLVPVLAELLSRTNERRSFVYLSDGGHFENLGLYEMVRRRCHRMLVVDAGCDPDYQYEDLENAIRKIRVDFGIEITFDNGLLRPEDARSSGLHYCRGTIHYSQGQAGVADGEIIYIKPLLSGDESVDLRRYAESTRSDGRVFPQQPTSDQFFDEAQFESYRELGLHSVLQTFPQIGPEDAWPAPIGPKPAGPVAAGVAETRTAPRWAPESKKAETSGTLGAFGSLSQAAVLASALTITTAITVTGAVALKDTELHLAEDSRTLRLAAGEGLSVTLADKTVVRVDVAGSIQEYLNQSDSEAVKVLNSTLKQRLENLQLNVKIGSGGDGPTSGGELDAAIKAIDDAAAKLAGVAGTLSTTSGSLDAASGNLNSATNTLRNQVNETVRALNTAITVLNKTVEPVAGNVRDIRTTLTEDLSELKSLLVQIHDRVAKISPRETVRGN